MKTRAHLSGLLVAAACSASAAACSSSTGRSAGSSASGDDGGADAAAAASWQEDAAVRPGGDTWAGWEQGFFAKYCVECHGASDPQMRDYRSLAGVVKDRDTIRCGIAPEQPMAWGCATFPPPRQFPISDQAGTNPKPSDDERNRVVAWIDAGCP